MYPYLFGWSFMPMYSVMIAVGVIAGLIYAYYSFYKREHLSSRSGLIMVAIAAITSGFMLLGASFFDSLFHSIEAGEIGIYGITYLGSLVVGLPVAVILIHKFMPFSKGRALYTLSLIIPALVLCHGFGRIGCFCAGCCYGVETDSWIGVSFPIYQGMEIIGYTPKVLPTQLFEAFFEFVLFGLMVIFDKKIKGHQLEIYLIVYCVFRFIIEFWRGDDRGSTGIGISPAQLLDIFCIICAILIILFYKQIIFKKLYRKCIIWQEEAKNIGLRMKKEKRKSEPTDIIKDLYKMKESGMITEAEYEEQKQKLLKKIQ